MGWSSGRSRTKGPPPVMAVSPSDLPPSPAVLHPLPGPALVPHLLGLSFHARSARRATSLTSHLGPFALQLPFPPPVSFLAVLPATAILSVFLLISMASLPTGMRTPRGQGECPEGSKHTGVPGTAAPTTAEWHFGPRHVPQPQGPCFCGFISLLCR